MIQSLPGSDRPPYSQVDLTRAPIKRRDQGEEVGKGFANNSSGRTSVAGSIGAMLRGRRKAFLVLGILFAISAGCLYLLFQSFPELSENDKQFLRLPRTLDDAKELGRVLSQYTDTHFPHVVVGYFFTYVFLQTFAIPGSIFLSVLSGFLFPFVLALTLVCLCSACGASGCYLISDLVLGRTVVARWFPERVEEWKSRVAQYGWVDLLSSLIFLRITPFLPNWFINVASPVIGFPLWIFFVGTFIGVAPPTALAVISGQQLYEMTSATEFITGRAVALIALIAVMALMPMVFKRLLGRRIQPQRESQD